MSQSLSTCNADFGLFFNLKRTDIGRLSLLMHSILSLFTLNAQSFYIVCSFGLNLSRGNIFCYGHKLPVTLARLINLNSTNINARNFNAESFF